MKNGPCPECNSTDVHYAKGEDGEGLRDEHFIVIRIGDLEAEVDTYVCMSCGYIGLFVAPENRREVAAAMGKSKEWKRVA